MSILKVDTTIVPWFFSDFLLIGKGTFLSEDTDAFVITSNRQKIFLPETENLNFGDF